MGGGVSDAPGEQGLIPFFPIVRMDFLPSPKYMTDTLFQVQSDLYEEQKVRTPWEGGRLIASVLHDIWWLSPLV